MKKIALIFALIAFQTTSYAAADLTDACKVKIQHDMLAQIKNLPGATQDVANYYVDVSVGKTKVYASLTGKNDGAYLTFDTDATDQDVMNCTVAVQLNLENSCQYSNYGDKDIDEIVKIEFGDVQTITTEKGLNSVQVAQIKELLIYGDESSSLDEMIADTDDGEVLLSTLTLPGGQKLDYYKTYGGDNPYGIFFYEGTLDIAGTNGDSSICIGYPKK